MRLAHISDLHLPGSNYVPQWGDNLVALLNELAPDLLVVTGDLVDEGHLHEYELVPPFLDRLDVENRLVVPGNHDARNQGYALFEELFGTRCPYFENDRVAVLGLDSSAPDLDDGHIGRENYELIGERFGGASGGSGGSGGSVGARGGGASIGGDAGGASGGSGEGWGSGSSSEGSSSRGKVEGSSRGERGGSGGGKWRIMALHHHLIPIPGTGRERNIPVDAGDVLELVAELGVDMVISGHKHLPWVWRLNDTHLITAGTACSRRLKGRSYPSFNLFEISDKKIALRQFNVSDKTSQAKLEIGR